jgi:uncharacterized membrane protein YfcA
LVLGGLVAGFFGSILGLGGGIFIIPMLTLIFGLPMQTAVATSLVCVIATSSGAANLYVKSGLADIHLGMTLELGTTCGAILGGLLAGIVSHSVLSFVFSLLLLYAAISMVIKRDETECQTGGSSGQEISNYKVENYPLGIIGSFFAGNVSGLLGVGGGIIKVPLMYLGMKVPLKVATATSNFMIGVTAVASCFIYYSRGDLNLIVTAITVAGVFIGAMLGCRILPSVKTFWLKRFFVLVLIYLWAKMMFVGLGIKFLIF